MLYRVKLSRVIKTGINKYDSYTNSIKLNSLLSLTASPCPFPHLGGVGNKCTTSVNSIRLRSMDE